MLLKYCVFISILSHKTLCDIGVKTGTNGTILTTANNSTTFSRSPREFKNESLDLKESNIRIERRRSFRGRSVNDYNVITSDEYILTVYRMTYDNNNTPPEKCPVLLVHGMYQSSDQFLQQIGDQNLALKLQDLGYDVWLANFRGNHNSRQHLTLDPETDKLKFFNYSYEEIGVYDVASIVDFVLKITSFDKLVYIGHSLGGTVFLVLNSLKPEYNNKFVTAYLMAPLGYQHYFPNDKLEAEISSLEGLYEKLLKEGIVEIFPYTDKNVKFSAADCLGSSQYEKICHALNIQRFMALKYVNNDVSETRGGSIKQLFHLAQNVKSKSFSRWDYGEIENMRKYGSFMPPEYNLELVTAPTNMIYTPNDEFVSPEDIADMAEEMGNARIKNVSRSNFTHADFVFGTDVMENVYADIIKELEENPNVWEEHNKHKKKKCCFFVWSLNDILLFLLLLFIIALIALLILICYREIIHVDNNQSIG